MKCSQCEAEILLLLAGAWILSDPCWWPGFQGVLGRCWDPQVQVVGTWLAPGWQICAALHSSVLHRNLLQYTWWSQDSAGTEGAPLSWHPPVLQGMGKTGDTVRAAWGTLLSRGTDLVLTWDSTKTVCAGSDAVRTWTVYTPTVPESDILN